MAFILSKNEANNTHFYSKVFESRQIICQCVSDESITNESSIKKLQAFQEFPCLMDESSNQSTPRDSEQKTIYLRKVPIKIILGDKAKEKQLRGRKIKSIQNEKPNGPSFVVERKKSRHSKYSHDNILRKIKVCFQRFLIHFSNQLIKELYGVQKFKIRKLSGNITQNVTLKFNKPLLNYTIADILSDKTSMKYSSVSIDQNKKNIAKLLSKPFFSQFFNMTYKEVYQKLFIENDISIFDKKYHEYMTNLYNIDYVYNYMLVQYEQDYREKILETARNFISYFESGSIRKNAIKD